MRRWRGCRWSSLGMVPASRRPAYGRAKTGSENLAAAAAAQTTPPSKAWPRQRLQLNLGNEPSLFLMVLPIARDWPSSNYYETPNQPAGELTYLLTYLLSHSRGTPLSHPHCPVGQLRSRVVEPEYVGHRWWGQGGGRVGRGGAGGTTTLLSRRSPCRHPCLLTFSCPPPLGSC